MNALDTNVLIRFLIQDDAAQAEKVNRLFEQAELAKDRLHVPLLLVLEVIWVLESVYAVSRGDILQALGELLSMPVLSFEKQDVIRAFITAAVDNNHDLSNILIAQSALENGCKLTLTFDKRAANSSFFQKL